MTEQEGEYMNADEQTKPAGSQKADALEKYSKALDLGLVHDNWRTLKVHRFDLIPPGEPVTAEAIYDVLERAREFSPMEAREDRPLFIRACPLNPRPGVLESSAAYDDDKRDEIFMRIVNTMLSKENSATPMYDHGYVDPHGSIIVQRYVEANASCVAAPGSYIIMGPDNDGVTAGKAGLKIAIPHTLSDTRTTANLHAVGIKPENIELEFVSMLNLPNTDSLDEAVHSSHSISHRHYLVQLRGSSGHAALTPPPSGVTINGIIPSGTIEVKHVHYVHNEGDDELSRMEAALHAGLPDGAVVVHPTGTHLSHHAGQCRKYGVPYIVSDTVQVGSTWVEVAPGWVIDDPSFEPQPYNPYEYLDSFAAGLSTGIFRYARQYGWLSNHFHQFIGGPLMAPDETAYFAGVYVGWVLNSTLAVALGEMRHAPGRKNNLLPSTYPLIDAMYDGAWEKGQATGERQHYYIAVEKKPLTIGSITAMLDYLADAYNTGWQGGGYGGKAYGLSCEKTATLSRAIQKFVGSFSEEDLLAVIDAANAAEHNVHNNGYFFNKFMSNSALDWGTDPKKIRMEPSTFFLVYYAATHAWQYRDAGFPGAEDKTELIQYVSKLTPTMLRKEPLFMRSDLPAELDAVRERTLNKMYYVHSGMYGSPDNDKFIPCGLKGCDTCVQAIEAIEQLAFSSAGMWLGVAEVDTDMLDLSYPTAYEDVEEVTNKYPHEWGEKMVQLKMFSKDMHSYETVAELEEAIALGYYISQVANDDAALHSAAVKAVSNAEYAINNAAFCSHIKPVYNKHTTLAFFLAMKEHYA